ncbi:hypothetical protein SCA6_010025 [Theobroma cacao]
MSSLKIVYKSKQWLSKSGWRRLRTERVPINPFPKQAPFSKLCSQPIPSRISRLILRRFLLSVKIRGK